MELAGWWSRVGAWLLDFLFQVLLGAGTFGLLIAVDSVGGVVDTVGTIVFAPAVVIVYFGYPAFTMRRAGARNGQTWGKQIFRIRAVRDDGAAYGVGTALVREVIIKQLLIGFVGTIAFSIPFLLDSLWPLWDESNRAVHDMIVSSHVVRA